MINNEIFIPFDVPKKYEAVYLKNHNLITRKTGRLMLFAGDQRVEHLNDDFYGKGIALDDVDPEHLFRIANMSRIGVFATQLGLIAKYARNYKKIPYLVKMNSKTSLIDVEQKDPLSLAWYSIEQVLEFAKRTGLNIPAVGYTIYLGSEFENEMLREAAQIIHKAHQNGLIVVLWIYPRGKAVINEKNVHLIAGAANVAGALGADFVKVSYPSSKKEDPSILFKEVVKAGGRTRVICAGGANETPKDFLETLHKQIFVSGASGNATGRNIHQKTLTDAVRFCNAIASITFDGLSAKDALRIYKK
jgi:fructose-bisphosphate aldolase/6-deoxy-5-ketofructose 1-phosphate synthase